MHVGRAQHRVRDRLALDRGAGGRRCRRRCGRRSASRTRAPTDRPRSASTSCRARASPSAAGAVVHVASRVDRRGRSRRRCRGRPRRCRRCPGRPRSRSTRSPGRDRAPRRGSRPGTRRRGRRCPARAGPRPSGSAARSSRSAARTPPADAPTSIPCRTRRARSSWRSGGRSRRPGGRSGRLPPPPAPPQLEPAVTGVAFTLPGSGSATLPLATFFGVGHVGEVLAVVDGDGASGSSAERKSAPHLRARFAAPNCFCASWSTSADFSSLPPPLPKIPPTSAAVAMMSVTFHGLGPIGWLIAPYSPGIRLGFSFACVDVGVDAVDVGLGVVLDLLALGAVEVVELVVLALQVGLGVGRDRPLLRVEVRLPCAPPANELSCARPTWRSTSMKKSRSSAAM